MLVPRGQDVNLGDPVEFRIKKSQEMRSSTVAIQNLLTQYSAQAKILSALEQKISKELLFFYQGDNIYAPQIAKLAAVANYREELFRKEVNNLDRSLAGVRDYEKTYDSLSPFVKKYYKSKKRLDHYERKLPRVLAETEARRLAAGQISKKDAAWLMRNQKKLEGARVDSLVGMNNIVELSDRINLERFEKINPIIIQYIHYQVISANVTVEKLAELDNYQEPLKRKETADFNRKFFVELDKDTVDRYTRSQLLPEGGSQIMHKSNIQNNYYYVNDPNAPRPALAQGDTANGAYIQQRDSLINGGQQRESLMNGQQRESLRNSANRGITSMADGLDHNGHPNPLLLSENVAPNNQGMLAIR